MYDFHVIKWYVDAAFYVYADFKSCAGGIMAYERAFLILKSIKQKVDTRRSTESEFVGTDNMYTIVLWKNYLWNNKASMLIRILSINTTREKFYWRKMGKRVQARGIDQLTLIIYL